MKSIFDDAKGKGKEVQTRSVPSSFPTMARRFVETLRNQLSENEVRALAASKVASPGLQVTFFALIYGSNLTFFLCRCYCRSKQIKGWLMSRAH